MSSKHGLFTALSMRFIAGRGLLFSAAVKTYVVYEVFLRVQVNSIHGHLNCLDIAVSRKPDHPVL